MLALIGLKKFRCFHHVHTMSDLLSILVKQLYKTVDAFYGRRDTKQGVSGPAPEWRGVSRSFESPGDGSAASLGAQRRKKDDGKRWI